MEIVSRKRVPQLRFGAVMILLLLFFDGIALAGVVGSGGGGGGGRSENSGSSIRIDLGANSGAQVSSGGEGSGGGGGFTSRIVQLIGLVTILSLAPSIIMMITSFTRIIVVFSILRNSIGLQQTPPNAVLTGLAIFLTFFIMQPCLEKSYDDGIKPLIEEQIGEEEAWDKIVKPFHGFMLRNTPAKEISLFTGLAGVELRDGEKDSVPFRCLVPAFMISELKKSFQIGFLLFLPFMIIDILVASILMSMGMMMLPPAMISLPIKVIFFVMVDGWYLLCGSLAKSYGM